MENKSNINIINKQNSPCIDNKFNTHLNNIVQTYGKLYKNNKKLSLKKSDSTILHQNLSNMPDKFICKKYSYQSLYKEQSNNQSLTSINQNTSQTNLKKNINIDKDLPKNKQNSIIKNNSNKNISLYNKSHQNNYPVKDNFSKNIINNFVKQNNSSKIIRDISNKSLIRNSSIDSPNINKDNQNYKPSNLDDINNLKKNILNDLNSFNHLILEKKIKKIRNQFTEFVEGIKNDSELKSIGENLFKFIDHLLENLEKDKMLNKLNLEISTHNKTKKNLKEMMNDLEKNSTELQNINKEYESFKIKYQNLECKFRDNQIIFKRQCGKIQENKNLKNYIIHLEHELKKIKNINDDLKIIKLKNFETNDNEQDFNKTNESNHSNQSHFTITELKQKDCNKINQTNQLPNLDLRKLEIEQFDDDEFINDDQNLDEYIEKELNENPAYAIQYNNLDEFKHYVYNKYKNNEIDDINDNLNIEIDHQSDKILQNDDNSDIQKIVRSNSDQQLDSDSFDKFNW